MQTHPTRFDIHTEGQKIKSNVHYTRGITPKRVTSGGAHLCGLAPGLHSSEETSQRWRAVGDTVADLTGPRIEPQTSRSESVRLATELTSGCHTNGAGNNFVSKQ